MEFIRRYFLICKEWYWIKEGLCDYKVRSIERNIKGVWFIWIIKFYFCEGEDFYVRVMES